MMIVGQHEIQREQQRDDADMQGKALAGHRVAVPNRPCGRKTSTSATTNVASILASVGEKNIEMMPSDRPISSAAINVPRSEPSPPMMTTMKDRSSGSRPIK